MMTRPSARVLVVEDDALQAEALEFMLRQEGYLVQTVGTGEECLARTRGEPSPDLVILDVSLPDLSGVEVARRLRTYSAVPLVMLTARREQVDKVIGLDTGADDYVTKPFETNELLARIRAQLRRVALGGDVLFKHDGVLVVGELQLDVGTRRVRYQGKTLSLSAREFDILRLLAEADGRVVERQQLLASVWGSDHFGNDRALDVYVHLLRGKIEPEPAAPRYLHTVRGVGYRLAYEPGTDGAERLAAPGSLSA